MNRGSSVLMFLFLAGCGANAPPVAASDRAAPTAGANDAAAAPAEKTGSQDCTPFEPTPPAPAHRPPLPPIPELSNLPRKSGDAFTVHGAVHALRSRHESAALAKEDVTVLGFIVDSNLLRAPKCAVHKAAVKDPPSCESEVPAFTIADAKGTATGARIQVMGWASSVAQVYEASLRYKGLSSRPASLYRDDVFGVDVPFPLPAVGAQVKVTGRYAFSFTRSSRGIVSDRTNGILTATKIEMLEPPPKPFAFP